MNETDLIRYVQAHFNDQTAQFRDRIVRTIPVAIEMFGTEHQWEFLDKYTTTTATTSTTHGKDVITLPSDFFKPVVLYTDDEEMEYVDRTEWGLYQRHVSVSRKPWKYTQIGPELILSHATDGSTIYMVYTRQTSGMSLSDVPSQYHDAIAAAVVWRLTPGSVMTNQGPFPNPAYAQAERFYSERIRVCMGKELSVKGRRITWKVTGPQAERSSYR